MSLLDYIRGHRKGKAAHRLEKEAMHDPFLSEALDGFDMVEDDHMARIEAIRNKIGKTPSQKEQHHKQSIWTSVAAVAVVLLTIVGITHFGTANGDGSLHAQSAPAMPISIYIPEAVYTENIAVIATKNTELTRDVSVRVDLYHTDFEQHTIEYDILEKELLALESGESFHSPTPSKEENLEAIQIYIPTGINASQRRVNQSPEPLIGLDEYKKYLKREIRRPSVPPCENKKGKVLLEFSVDDEGNPYNIVVEYGFCGASDDEAVRLLKEGPRWTPSNVRGQLRVEF